jgi:hypothetical protein
MDGFKVMECLGEIGEIGERETSAPILVITGQPAHRERALRAALQRGVLGKLPGAGQGNFSCRIWTIRSRRNIPEGVKSRRQLSIIQQEIPWLI